MSDIELIELAAKAAGILGITLDDGEFFLNGARSPDNSPTWDPLNRDGDALRLAVSIPLLIRHSANRMEAYLMGYPRTKSSIQFKYDPDSPASNQPEMQAAARRAIVMAAANVAKMRP